MLCAILLRTRTKIDLVLSLGEFYTIYEIVTAKKTLFTAAKAACPDLVPQLVACKGANKRHADTYDIISLVALMDANKTVLPTFTAIDLGRLPTLPSLMEPATSVSTVNPAVVALEDSVRQLQDQMSVVLTKLDDIRYFTTLLTLNSLENS
jgi:hypothetical protein